MANGGVRIGLSLAAVGCLLMLAADQSPRYYAPAAPRVRQYGGLALTPAAQMAHGATMIDDTAGSVPVYGVPQTGAHRGSIAFCVLAFCAAAITGRHVSTLQLAGFNERAEQRAAGPPRTSTMSRRTLLASTVSAPVATKE